MAPLSLLIPCSALIPNHQKSRSGPAPRRRRPPMTLAKTQYNPGEPLSARGNSELFSCRLPAPPASLRARFSLQTGLQSVQIGGTFAAFLLQVDCRESWLDLVRPEMASFSPKAGVEVQLWEMQNRTACVESVRTGFLHTRNPPMSLS